MKRLREISKLILFTSLIVLIIPLIGLIIQSLGVNIKEFRVIYPRGVLFVDSFIWTIIIVAIPLFYRLVYKKKLFKFNLYKRHSNLTTFTIGVISGFFLFILVDLLTSLVFNNLRFTNNHNFNLIFIINSIYLLIIRALFEEYYFRGFLLTKFRKIGLPIWHSIIFSSLFFCAFHIANRYPLYSYINLFVFGFCNSLIFLKTKTIWYSVGLHFIYNWTIKIFISYDSTSLFAYDYDMTHLGVFIKQLIFPVIIFVVIIYLNQKLLRLKMKKLKPGVNITYLQAGFGCLQDRKEEKVKY